MGKKIKVLIVDDAVMMRTIIRGILTENPDIDIVGTAENGQLALAVLKSATPDVVLCDIEMPVMDGLTFLQHATLQSRAKVIILSSIAVANSETAIKAKRLGAAAVLQKPSGSISFDLREKSGKAILQAIRTFAA